MKQRTGINYLFCRNGRYTVRVQVPKDVQSKLNRTEFKRSLGADFVTAKRQCHSVIADFLSQIEAARRASSTHTLTTQPIGFREIEAAVREHYDRMAARISESGSTNRHEKIAALNLVIENQLSVSALKMWSAAAQDAEWLCEEHSWKLDPNGAEFEHLCETMVQARIQAYRNEVRRLEGIRAADPNFDPLFEPKQTSDVASKTLGELIDEFNAERELRWSASTKVNYRIITRVLEEICGRQTPVADIDRAFCLKVRDTLMRLPSNYQKKPATKDRSISEAIQIGERLGLPRMMPATINSHLTKLGAIIAVGRNAGLIAGNPTANLKIPDDVRPEEKRDPFSISQLNRIFASAPWSDGPQAAAVDASKFWGPLVALFSGARLSEIFGQLVDEVVERDGRLVFDFRHRPGERDMKHNRSRMVPVHPTLIDLGFASFIDDARASGRILLFAEAKRDERGKWGDAVSDWFSRRIKRLGLTGTNLSFHSFRHSFEDALREADLHNTPIGNQIAGRVTPGVSSTYGNRNQFSTAKLIDAVDKVAFSGLDLSHLMQK